MALLTPSGWFQSSGTNNSAEQLRNYAGLLAGPASTANSLIVDGGVHSTLGNQLSVTETAPASMGVYVLNGAAVVPGTQGATQGSYFVVNDATVTVPITAAHASLNRIDLVIVRVQDQQYGAGANSTTLETVVGTAAASPVAPTPPANSLVLAQVLVGAAVTTIVNANITDVRTWFRQSRGYTYLTTVEYTTSGSFLKSNYDGIQAVVVEGVGAGGGGGGAPTTAAGQVTVGAGGAAGGYARKFILGSALSATTAVTVGTGGAGGDTLGNVGATGGTSSFASFITCPGGGGGNSMAAGTAVTIVAGGIGGIASGGDINITGSDGENAIRLSGTLYIPAGGGASMMSGYQRYLGLTVGGAGVAGKLYGGGGSGGYNSPSQTGVAGGAGANGLIQVHVYV